ncbi:MAG: hypothetical protein HOQ09_02920 [Gemmatimonadaceae bacterium]|nr:hypothetical protein [Gemmatimonadaceae bacterium]
MVQHPTSRTPALERPAGAADAPAAAEESIFDLGLVRDAVGFAARALRRHRRTALTIFLGVVASSILILAIWPRTYVTEAKLLAERNLVMPVLGNPQRNLPSETDTPTRLASEAILKHDNLVAIINATDLVSHWDNSRSLLARARDWVHETVSRKKMTREDRVEALVWALNHRMWVNVGEGTVTIGVQWSDPYMAYRIVQAAQENFFEERHTQELALISESIDILQDHVEDVNSEIRASLDSMAQVRAELAPSTSAPRAPVARTVSPAARDAQSRLDAVERTIADLEQFRNRRLAELQATLADQRNVYGSAHPQIAATEQMIRALGTDSPQLAELRREQKQLRATLARLAPEGTTATPTNADPYLAAAALRSLERMQSDSLINERQQYARSRLKIAVNSYEGLLQRLDAARIELQTARAAFKYKYGVLVPAQVSRAPVKPRPPLVLAGGLFLAVLLSFFTAVGLDVMRGELIEPWQVRRLLDLNVLGAAGEV